MMNAKIVIYPKRDKPLTAANIKHIYEYTHLYLTQCKHSYDSTTSLTLDVGIDFAIRFIDSEIQKTKRIIRLYGIYDVTRDRIVFLQKERASFNRFKERYINTPHLHSYYTKQLRELQVSVC